MATFTRLSISVLYVCKPLTGKPYITYIIMLEKVTYKFSPVNRFLQFLTGTWHRS